jgi:hypothetical protein
VSPQGFTALATAAGADVVVDGLVVGAGRAVELVVDRATCVVVGPERARPDGLPPQDANPKQTTAHSTAARAAPPAPARPLRNPAVVISPPGAA